MRHSRLHHWLTASLWVPTFSETRFRASDHSYKRTPYQACAFRYIPQTAYIWCCLALLGCSELLRTPFSGSPTSENTPSTHFGE
jgi:hypothetical protein